MVRRAAILRIVVNLAARAADYARAHEILVTQEVIDAWSGGDSIYFRAIGAVASKNVSRRVELFQVLPAETSAPRRANPDEVAALVDERELAHPIVGVARRHQAAAGARIGGNADAVPFGVERVGVGPRIKQEWSSRGITSNDSQVELDLAATQDQIAVRLGRCAPHLESEPLVEVEGLAEIPARHDRDGVLVDLPRLARTDSRSAANQTRQVRTQRRGFMRFIQDPRLSRLHRRGRS